MFLFSLGMISMAELSYTIKSKHDAIVDNSSYLLLDVWLPKM